MFQPHLTAKVLWLRQGLFLDLSFSIWIVGVLIQTTADTPPAPLAVYIQKLLFGSGLPSEYVGDSEKFREMDESRGEI